MHPHIHSHSPRCTPARTTHEQPPSRGTCISISLGATHTECTVHILCLYGDTVHLHSWENAIFFVVFVIVGNFFVTNLFIGVLVNSFQQSTGSAIMTEVCRRFPLIHTLRNCLLAPGLQRQPRGKRRISQG